MAEDDAPVRKKKNWFVKHKILTALLLIIVIAIVASAVNSSGSGSNNNNSNDTSTSNESNKKSSDKTATVAKVGEPARDGKFEFTVSSFKCGDSTITQPDNSYVTTQAQGQFCQMQLSVKNIGSVQQNFAGSNQYVYSSDATQYSYSSTGTIYANNSASQFALYQDINPGVTVSGVLAFDVPKGTSPTYAMLHDSSASNGIKVNLQ